MADANRTPYVERGSPAPEGCSLYFVIGDTDELSEFHSATGVEILELWGDRRWQLRDYTVVDLDGYALTFGHGLPARTSRCSRSLRGPSSRVCRHS